MAVSLKIKWTTYALLALKFFMVLALTVLILIFMTVKVSKEDFLNVTPKGENQKPVVLQTSIPYSSTERTNPLIDRKISLERLRSECLRHYPILKENKSFKVVRLMNDEKRLSPQRMAYMKYFMEYANNIDYNCTYKERMGNMEDGGWYMCLDPGFAPQNPCLVFSFGIFFNVENMRTEVKFALHGILPKTNEMIGPLREKGGDWSFDDTIANVFACRIHSFDPTIRTKDHVRKGLIHFHKVGIGEKDEVRTGLPYLTLRSIMNTYLNESSSRAKGEKDGAVVIDYLKIDVETWEWTSLRQMALDGILKDRVKQLAVEFHIYGLTSLRTMKEVFELLKSQGFRLYHGKGNAGCKILQMNLYLFFNCYELHFVNIRFSRKGLRG